MKHLLTIATIFVMISCGTTTQTKKDISSLTDTLYNCKYAERFEVFGTSDSITLRVHNPWQGASGVSFDYSFPRKYRQAPRIVCMSSSHIAFLDALNATENIVGVSGINFITNDKIQLAQTPDVGYDNNLNYELIVALKPDFVFVYEVMGENSVTTKKLEQLGIPVIYISDYLEQTPLARSEWIVAFGAILGRTEQASEIFDDIAKKYNNVKDSVSKLSKVKPKVMLNTPYRDVWYVPGDRSYIVQLINDAGGDYLAKGTDSDISRPISSEVAYELLNQADVWLNPSMSKTMQEILNINHRFTTLDVVRRGEVYNNNLRSTTMGGSDFWESGSLRSDIVLADLAKILNKQAFEEHKLYYYHKLK